MEEFEPVRLGELKRNRKKGAILMIIGIALILLAMLMLANRVGVIEIIAAILMVTVGAAMIIYGSGVYRGFYEVACPSCSKKVRFVRMKPPNRMPCLGCQRYIYVDGEYVKVAAKDKPGEADKK